MSQIFHTPIPFGSPANAVTFNSVYEELDYAVGIQGGGVNATNNYLLNCWMAALNRMTSVTTDVNGLITNADVIWPDGSTGEYEVLDTDPVWLEATAWRITHFSSGKTLSFSGLTRDINGRILTPGSFTIL